MQDLPDATVKGHYRKRRPGFFGTMQTAMAPPTKTERKRSLRSADQCRECKDRWIRCSAPNPKPPIHAAISKPRHSMSEPLRGRLARQLTRRRQHKRAWCITQRRHAPCEP